VGSQGWLALETRLGDRVRVSLDLDADHLEGGAAARADLQRAATDDVGDHFAFALVGSETLRDAGVGLAVRCTLGCSLAGLSFEPVQVDATIAPPDVWDAQAARPADRRRARPDRPAAGPVGASGVRTWRYLYRLQNSRRLRRLELGEYPTLSLEDARKEVLTRRQAVEVRGEDPAAEKAEWKKVETWDRRFAQILEPTSAQVRAFQRRKAGGPYPSDLR
jgi:hypothetical protein